ncbi:hypothetical protein [Secundilactobacillus silagei]|nr:hypothetical protein [Secundilactobacillus silagei]
MYQLFGILKKLFQKKGVLKRQITVEVGSVMLPSSLQTDFKA